MREFSWDALIKILERIQVGGWLTVPNARIHSTLPRKPGGTLDVCYAEKSVFCLIFLDAFLHLGCFLHHLTRKESMAVHEIYGFVIARTIE